MRTIHFEDLIASAEGTVRHEVTDKDLRLSRFTGLSQQFWSTREEFAQIRANCSSGVILRFSTNATELRLRAQLGAGARASGAFDIWTGDVMIGVIGGEKPPEILEETITLPGSGEREITLHLPQMRACTIEQLQLSESSSFSPLPKRRTLLALGDSITQGMDSINPSLSYMATIARELGLAQLNQAIGGWIFSPESLPEKPCESPALITVAYGTNDFGRGLPLQNIGAYVKRVRELYPQTPLVLLAPIYRLEPTVDGPHAQSGTGGYTLAEMRTTIQRIAEETNNCFYVSEGKLLPAKPEFYRDLVHPNALGHYIYGSNVAKILRSFNIL